MRLLETSPKRYDKGIKIITLGKDLEIKKLIVEKYISEGSYVLDIGAGTGTLAIMCAKKGAKVFAFDKSDKMLSIASEKIKEENLEDKIKLEVMSVVEMDTRIKSGIFDIVLATLVFSELSDAEQDYALKQIYRVLKNGGLLIIEDEVRPKNKVKKLLFYLIRAPLVLFTYIVSQSIPKPVKGLDEKVKRFGFKIVEKNLFLLDSLMLLVAEKIGDVTW